MSEEWRVKEKNQRCLAPRWLLALCLVELTLHSPLSTVHWAEAAVSKGKNQQLEAAEANQGGGVATSSKFRQQLSVGGGVAGNRLSSSKFRLSPGFLGASLSGITAAVPVMELDITVLSAKTEPGAFGLEIPPKTWQQDRSPVFLWEPPPTGPDVAGYSYAIDGSPDDVIDTTATSFNVAAIAPGTWTDGTRTFAVKALNSAGNSGNPISVELWIDTTPPQVVTYAPPADSLVTTPTPPITAVVSDAHSGVDPDEIALLVNSVKASILFDEQTGTITARGATLREGEAGFKNLLNLSVTDRAGNASPPLLWNVTVDTKPPTGTVTINAGAEVTTSVYVTLNLDATDATSGVARVLLSNDELGGYVEEPYAPVRELWKLNSVKGPQSVYVKFIDEAGNVSEAVSDTITLDLLAPDTVITSGPAGFVPTRDASFAFECAEGDCVFSVAFDNEAWSDWNPVISAAKAQLPYGNHYFRVKAAREANGTPGIQPDEEDPSPAERTWIVGVEPPIFSVPTGPPVKLWRIE